MICKDCLHFDVCKDATVPNPEYKGVQPDKSKECRHFKNKADYVEVKRGYWKMEYHETRSTRGRLIRNKTFTCSNCNRRNGRITTKYCSNCGVKMDGKGDT